MSILNGSDRTRRLVHLLFGAAALLIPWLGRGPCLGIAFSALLYNAVLAPALRWDRAYRRPGEGRWNGLVTYPLSVLLVLLLAPPPVAAGAWVVLAVLDPIAATVGRAWPRPAVPGNPRKSLTGSVAGWLAASVACTAILHQMGVTDPVGPACAAAAAAMIAEAAPLPGHDNPWIAAASAMALYALIG